MAAHPTIVTGRVPVELFFLLVAVIASLGPTPAAPPPARIVSLVPAVTETLFAIGAGHQVVGVSSYDREPREVARLPRVGALIDPDLERILALRPDLVVVYASQHELRHQLARAGIDTLPYAHGGLAQVFDTIEQLGATAGRNEGARELSARLRRRLDEIGRRVAGRPRPSVLLVIGREPLSLRNIHASGGRGFLHDLLERAGGANAFADVARESLQVSTEQVLARGPDAIVELRADGMEDETLARERAAWSSLGTVPAVRSGRIHLLTGQELVIPGPRVADAAERLSRVLHPEVWR